MSTNEPLAILTHENDEYVLSYRQIGLQIRGKFQEWVFHAAQDILRATNRASMESEMDELEYMVDENVDEATRSIRKDLLKYQMNDRFGTIPQCGVTYKGEEYRWVEEEGRAGQSVVLQKLLDSSMKRKNTA